MSISSLQARAQQLLQKFFSTPSPSGPIIDTWHLFSLVRAMWKWMIRPLLWVTFSFPFKFTWWLMKAQGVNRGRRYGLDYENESRSIPPRW